ncbi:MAG: hypothetical protein WBP12_01670 [Candidatus Saccharimonas sp.]
MSNKERSLDRHERPSAMALRDQLATRAGVLCAACPLATRCETARRATCETIIDVSDQCEGSVVDYLSQLMDDSIQLVYARPHRPSPPQSLARVQLPAHPQRLIRAPVPTTVPVRMPQRLPLVRRAHSGGETLPQQIADIIALALGKRAVERST